MKVVFLGAPGAGKGTQAALVCERYNIPHISTGDIFRQNINNKTPIGIVAKSYIDKGQLVPDEVTIELVKGRILQDDCKNGYLLDGFPRDVAQAEAFLEIDKLDAVIDIVIPFERLMRRLTGRRVCANCRTSFHVDFIGSLQVCPKCGGQIIQRADDTEETVAKRLDVYTEQTAPVSHFYEKLGLLHHVNGDQTIEAVFEEIVKVLG
jgi:adenylate kinase